MIKLRFGILQKSTKEKKSLILISYTKNVNMKDARAE